uniref:Uncharacterized protein n=1 Tax=Arundo donax TaxID=35708 RepID=A0A0A9GRX0_ARUDO
MLKQKISEEVTYLGFPVILLCLTLTSDFLSALS